MGHSRASPAATQEGLEIEMPGKFEIMHAVREGLNNLKIDNLESTREWTRAVKTELCEIGRSRFDYKVGASATV